MSSKKKLIISLSVAVAIILAVVIALVAVFAAAQQNVNSVVNVTYRATDVVGSAKANYYVGTGSANKMTNDGKVAAEDDSNTVVSFLASDDTSSAKSLAPVGDISLDETNNYIIFEYLFNNTGARDYTASVTFSALKLNNMSVFYSTAAEKPAKDGTWTKWDDHSTKAIEITVASGATNVSCYVMAEIKDAGLDADFQGTFTWVLTATGTAA